MSSVVEQLRRIRNRLGRRLSRSLSRFDMADPAAAVGDADGCSSALPAGHYSCSASQAVRDATSDNGAARDGEMEAAAGGYEVSDCREPSVRADSDADMDVVEEPLYGFVGPPPSPVLAAASAGSDEAACSCCEPAGRPADCDWGPDDDDDPQLPADVAAAVRSARDSGAASRCGRLWRTLRALRLPRVRHQRRVASDESELPNVHENSVALPEPVIDLSRFRAEQFPVEDVDEEARRHRALELSAGVDGGGLQRVPAPHSESQLLVSHFAQLGRDGSLVQRTVHTTVDYVHCLVPDLQRIIGTPFYWGEMDRYEAERLLDNQPEGTFLLRDSAQEEYLFSVSFRRYVRSLHARVEQWNGQFTFDSHDPGVYASDTVTGLIEHYKDPSCCMFFEPMLTRPLHRNFVFPLSHLCRAAVVSQVSYDDIGLLRLPKSLRQFLMEYHYKQRIRVRRFELPDWREADSCGPADGAVSS